MCNGSRDDVGRAAHFFSKTSSHPASSTLHSGFRPLNGASIVVLHPFGLYRNLVYSTTFIPPLKVQENHSSQIKGNKQKVARFRATITEQFKNKKSEYPEGYSDGARGGSRTRTPLRALAPEASESTNSTTRAWRLRRVVQRKQYTTTKLCECQHFFAKKSFSCKKNVSAEKRIKLGEYGDRLDRAGRGMIKLVKQ